MRGRYFISILGLLVVVVAFRLIYLDAPIAGIHKEAVQALKTTRTLYHFVRKGDTIGAILAKYGIPPDMANALIASFRRFKNLRNISLGDVFEVEYSGPDKISAFRYIISPLEIYEAVKSDGEFIVSKIDVPVHVEAKTVDVQIDSSLYGAFVDAGESPQLIDEVVDVFAWDIDFNSDSQKGDKIRVLIEKKYVGDEFVEYGRMLSAEYDGATVKQKAYYYDKPGVAKGYFDEKGKSLARNFLKTPVKYTRISSGFGMRRHPVTHLLRHHMGTDYAAPTGAHVWAMADGVVTKKGYSAYNGNFVAIRHGRGFETMYLHLSRFYPGIAVGKRVRQKELIGYVGSTGRSTGPHLHLQISENGRNIDPLKIKKVKEVELAGKDLEAFRKETLQKVAEVTEPDGPIVGLPDIEKLFARN